MNKNVEDLLQQLNVIEISSESLDDLERTLAKCAVVDHQAKSSPAPKSMNRYRRGWFNRPFPAFPDYVIGLDNELHKVRP